ncbi:MAG: NUDIX domain-containing protein [Candidatus Nanohaloarchaea archaeon]
MRKNSVPAVKAVIVRGDGRVLLLKRSADETHLQGLWDVPGGSVDHDEHPREAVKREVREEAGIEINVLEPARTWSYTRGDGEHRVGIHYLCTPDSEDVSPGEEHTDFRWAGFQDLEEVEMYEDMRRNVEAIARERVDLPKLVRDRIPEIIRGNGEEPVTEVVEGGELEDFLAEKLVEEAVEYVESRETEEIADVLEVVDRILDVEEVEEKEVERVREEKKEERGGFDDNIVLRDVED